MLRNQVVDGFSLDLSILPVPGQYRTHAVSQMEALRRAGGYVPQWLVAPDTGKQVLSYGQTVEYQADLDPGSWIWGYNFSATFVADEILFNQPFRVSVLVEDAAGPILSGDYARGNAWGLLRSGQDLGGAPCLFDEPIPVVAPGRFNFVFARNEDTDSVADLDVTVQLVLSVAKPCKGPIVGSQACQP